MLTNNKQKRIPTKDLNATVMVTHKDKYKVEYFVVGSEMEANTEASTKLMEIFTMNLHLHLSQNVFLHVWGEGFSAWQSKLRI